MLLKLGRYMHKYLEKQMMTNINSLTIIVREMGKNLVSHTVKTHTYLYISNGITQD